MPGPHSSARSGSGTDRRDSSFPRTTERTTLVRLVSSRNLRVLDLRTEKNLDVLQVDDQISTGQHPDVWATCHRLVDAARRWWTDIDAIVYRSRTTPESSVNFAFFGDDGFDVESWPLGERTDVLTDLVLHEGFTVNWDIDGD